MRGLNVLLGSDQLLLSQDITTICVLNVNCWFREIILVGSSNLHVKEIVVVDWLYDDIVNVFLISAHRFALFETTHLIWHGHTRKNLRTHSRHTLHSQISRYTQASVCMHHSRVLRLLHQHLQSSCFVVVVLCDCNLLLRLQILKLDSNSL